MTKIRVLHLVTSLRLGGAERQLVTLLKAFDRQSFDHHVGVLQVGGALEQEVEELGLPLLRLGFRQRFALRTLWRLTSFLRTGRIQVLHTHLHLAGTYGRLAGTMVGTPCMLYTEHQDVTRRALRDRMIEQILRTRTSAKITVSEAQRQASMKLERYRPDRVHTIANSIVAADFTPSALTRSEVRLELGVPSNAVVVGNIANHIGQKRLDRLVERFAVIAATRPHMRLILIGDGPLHEDLRKLADRRGIAEQTLFLGRRNDVARLLQGFDMFAITSEWEGMPINLLEAMGAALPIVATDVGGISMVLENGTSGYLVAENDVTGFQERLAELADNEELRGQFGRSGRERVEREHDAALNARRIEQLYQSLLDRCD